MPDSQLPIRVFLADDSALIRSRVGNLLESKGALIVGEGETPRGCIASILALRPDVVVLDVQLEGGTGLEVLQAVRPAAPGVAFVVFTNNSAQAYRTRYLKAGAARFLDKGSDSGQLAQAVAVAARQPDSTNANP
ncbi:response regulator [Caenimonas aquaedulcis]|uniref:Response regulator transcription factor n=1 Tax=Caenimonas aquaedulcis TaxID=2793270 RepID=A0A931MIU5_9BURK|nr:response regulator transcription factor [Caenimonas aquaedulcis]MBG9390214.1 response regulator transcription factor [Caenimonas aquaedulcis]